MHTENLKVWTDRLREPGLNQTTGALIEGEYEHDFSYCCLGVGCMVAGIPQVRINGTEAFVVNGMDFEALPPVEFHRWLGTDPDTTERSLDVYPDWPEGLMTADDLNLRGEVSCANLNDECSLTFAQIADVLDYFGIQA